VTWEVPRAYLHDLRHSLGAPMVVAIAALVTLAGTVTFVAVQSDANPFPVEGSGIYYYEGGAYHVTAWAYDAGGDPVAGLSADIEEYTIGAPTSSSGPYPATTNGAGELSVVIPVAEGPSVVIEFDYLSLDLPPSVFPFWEGAFAQGTMVPLGNLTPGTAGGFNALTSVGANFFSARAQVMAFAAGSNGSAPVGFRLEACSGAELPGTFPGNCTGWPTQELGSLTGEWTHASLPIFPANATFVIVQLVNATDAIVATLDLVPAPASGGGSVVQSSINPGVYAVSDAASTLTFLVAAVALVSSYWTYARPRLSGTVEPVLARPVTRGGLLLDRYAAVAIAVVAAAAVEVLLLDVFAARTFGDPLPPGDVLPLIAAAVVGGLGFAGLIFATAHAVRTPEAVLAVGIVLLAGSLLWSSIVLGILVYAHPAYPGWELSLLLVRSQLLLPTQIPVLAAEWLTGTSALGEPIGASLGGVGVAEAAGVAAAWVVVPLAVAYRRAVTRD
jgi:ABC-type transport system involved in multi-copper enzyme maturation permease subunit